MFDRRKAEGIMQEGKVSPRFNHHAMEIFRGNIRHVTGRYNRLLSPDDLPPE
jgi:hypothetical protein